MILFFQLNPSCHRICRFDCIYIHPHLYPPHIYLCLEPPPKKKKTATTLPETNMAPENGWLEYHFFLLVWPIFFGELLVLGSVETIDFCIFLPRWTEQWR